MSQRDSGYERKERDLYETPEWATVVLLPHIPKDLRIWEPACGSGKMARVLNNHASKLYTTDIDRGEDFLRINCFTTIDAIITNPPYILAQKFIERALDLTRPDGMVAMLLRTDFDHAKTRKHLFADHPAFAKKVVLRRRIKWFEDSKGSPSFNHAWYIWDWQNAGAPVLAYAA